MLPKNEAFGIFDMKVDRSLDKAILKKRIVDVIAVILTTFFQRD